MRQELEIGNHKSKMGNNIFLVPHFLFLSLVLAFSIAIAQESAIKLYPTPSQRSFPSAIATDAKGHIWFAALNANKIIVLEQETSVFSEYDIPTTKSYPTDIAVDSSGAIWFAEQDGNQISYLTLKQRPLKSMRYPQTAASL